MLWRSLIFLLILPALVFSYTIVRKGGRKIEGTLIRESADEVVIKDREGVTLCFKKDQIDWDKTTIERQADDTEKLQKAVPKQTEIKRTEKLKQWTGDPISVDFKDVDIRDLFRFLAETGKLNLMIDPSVKGTVTIKMTEAPWDQVLDVVCKTQGLGYTIDGNVVSIDK